jgi:hypothetical protein
VLRESPKSLASTIDGLIPFFDPFENYYADGCGNIDYKYTLSRSSTRRNDVSQEK